MINKGCVALSMNLHTGVDYFMGMSIDDLNDLAETVNKTMEEVRRRGKQK